MVEYRIEVPVEPKPKKRPKVYRWATVNPSLEDEQQLMEAVRTHPNCPEVPLKDPMQVIFRFYKAIPKNTAQWKRPYMEKGIIRPNIAPDLDNYVKLALDALNNLVWDDDRYIVDIMSSKYFSESPRIEIVVRTLYDLRKKTQLAEFEKLFPDDSSPDLDEFLD